MRQWLFLDPQSEYLCSFSRFVLTVVAQELETYSILDLTNNFYHIYTVGSLSHLPVSITLIQILSHFSLSSHTFCLLNSLSPHTVSMALMQTEVHKFIYISYSLYHNYIRGINFVPIVTRKNVCVFIHLHFLKQKILKPYSFIYD